MAQLRIKQIADLTQTLDAITGVVTVVETFDGNEAVALTFPARDTEGILVHVNGLKTTAFTWQKDGLDVVSETLEAGTTLVFNPVLAGFELQPDDEIKVTYEYLSNGAVTYTGASAGTGAQGPQGPAGEGIVGDTLNIGSITTATITLDNGSQTAEILSYDEFGQTQLVIDELYVGANSLYVNGKKVISDDSDTINISTDPGQNLTIRTAEGGILKLESDSQINIAGDVIVNSDKTISGTSAIEGLQLGKTKMRGDLFLPDQTKLYFHDSDSPIQTFIAANTDSPEDLEIHADQDIILRPDRNVVVGEIPVIDANGNWIGGGSIESTGSGAQGPQGPQGPEGEVGPQGPTGSQGAQGSTGSMGMKGATGDQGFQGPQGPIGVKGDQGSTGATGIPGDRGYQGNQGPQGNQGVPGGSGPINAKWKWSTATTPTSGRVTTSSGTMHAPTITAITFHDIDADGINRDATLDAVGPGSIIMLSTLGSPYAGTSEWTVTAVSEFGSYYVFTVSSMGSNGAVQPPADHLVYAELSIIPKPIEGPQGFQGVTGPIGSRGSQGFQGVTGPMGMQGAIGADGKAGEVGTYSGSYGDPNGILTSNTIGVLYYDVSGDVWQWDGGSWTPVASIMGANGAQGATGSTGMQGSTGSQGPKGDKGDAGAQGATGSNGMQG